MAIACLPPTELLQLLASLPQEIERRRAERDRVLEELAALPPQFLRRSCSLLATHQSQRFHRPTARRRRSVPVQFRHPQKHDLTRTDRGKPPAQDHQLPVGGRTMAELRRVMDAHRAAARRAASRAAAVPQR